ncbi:MAG: hypothetical protein U5K76_09475, partial [Woeseiaceae bacterium]|nr:hypothetical protein [Woeseiaceae bacterium]
PIATVFGIPPRHGRRDLPDARGGLLPGPSAHIAGSRRAPGGLAGCGACGRAGTGAWRDAAASIDLLAVATAVAVFLWAGRTLPALGAGLAIAVANAHAFG